MKATLRFNLDEGDELFQYACDGAHLVYAISNFKNEIRNKLKYGGADLDDKTLEWAREILFECLEEYSLNRHFQ